MKQLSIEKFSIDKSDWIKVKFGDVVFEPKETVKDPAAEGIEHVVGLEHIDSENIHLPRSESIEESTTFTKKFTKGDVLFGRRRAYLKKAAQADFEGICSGDITVMRSNEKLMPELLPFLVNNDKFFDYAITHSAGGLSPRVKFKDLAGYEFLLPPKEQQAELAELFLAVDNVIEKKKKTINKLKVVKDSFLSELFTLSEVLKKKIVAGIKTSSFKGTCFSDLCLDSMFGPRFSSNLYHENGNIASLRTTDLNNEGDINLSTMPRANLDEDKLSAHYLKGGDLVISRSGTCGVAAVFDGFDIPVVPAAFLIRFRLTEKVNPHYLRLYLNSSVGRAATEKISNGAVQKNLTSKALLALEIPLPNRSTQDRIVEHTYDLGFEKCALNLGNIVNVRNCLISMVF